MKYLIALLLCFTGFYCRARVKNSFAAIKYDSVVMYRYSPPHNNTAIIDVSGKLNSTVDKSARLLAADAADICAMLDDPTSYGGVSAKCFDPQLAFVFYRGVIAVNNLVICLGCNWIVFRNNRQAFLKYTTESMSAEFQKYLRNLEYRYHFSENAHD